MAIEFSGETGAKSYILYDPAPFSNLEQLTASFWINMDNVELPVKNVFYKQRSLDISVYNDVNPGHSIRLVYPFDNTPGIWGVYSLELTSGWVFVAITYDNTNVSNDPIFYINAVADTLDFDTTPIGNKLDDSAYPLYLGSASSTTYNYSLDGKLEDPRIYNRILSQTEITELYQARMVRSISSGLVFHPIFCGAKGLSRFDGITLGAANTIVDEIGGAIGVPSGSPIGRGNTIQRIY